MGNNAELQVLRDSLLELRRQMEAEAPDPAVCSPGAVIAYRNAAAVAERYISAALEAAETLEGKLRDGNS